MLTEKKATKIKQMTPVSMVAMTLAGSGIAILCISLLIPLCWCLYASLKGTLEYALDPFGWPKEFYFENYSKAFNKLVITSQTKRGIVKFDIWALIIHSIIYSLGTPFIGTFFTMLMAYVIARYPTKFSKILYNFGIFLMVFQVIGSMPSSMQLNKAIGRYDNLAFWILTSPSGCFSGMMFLLFYGQFKGFSNTYAEAAQMDGAGHYTILGRIYLPMAIPLFCVQFVLGFIGTWNNYSVPLIWMPSYPNLAYGLYLFQHNAPSFGATQPEVLAGFVIGMCPSFLLYICMQKAIVEKTQIGGLKG